MSIVTTRSFVAGNITSHAALAFLTILGQRGILPPTIKIPEQSRANSVASRLAFEAKNNEKNYDGHCLVACSRRWAGFSRAAKLQIRLRSS